MADHAHLFGRFVWHDLMTTDLTKSVAFYRSLFPEWSIEALPLGENGTYQMIRVNGMAAGGFVQLSADGGLAPHWMGYVAVDDCAGAVQRAEASGGKCVVPVVTLPGIGKFAVVRDGQGATFSPFELAEAISQPKSPASGQFAWNELLAKDLGQQRRFHESVCGWSSVETQIPDTGVYCLFKRGTQDVAGAMPMPPDANEPSCWLTYLYADNLDARSAKAAQLGAVTCVTPRDIPGIGRFAVHVDPAGAMFALFRL